MANNLPVPAPIRVRARRVPIVGRVEDHVVWWDPGREVGYYLDSIGYRVPPGCQAAVAMCGRVLDTEEWDRIAPRPGDVISVETLPLGGGGKGKAILGIFFSIAAIALAVALPAIGGIFAGLGATIGSTGITIGHALGAAVAVIGGLVTLPRGPSLDGLGNVSGSISSQAPDSPTYRIVGGSNQWRPWSPFPRPIGEFVWTPPSATRAPFQEVAGRQLYLRIQLVGYGPCAIDQIKIGETPISEFPGAQVEIREGWQDDPPSALFPSTVFDDNFNLELKNSNGWVSRDSQLETDELAVDFVLQAQTRFRETSTGRDPVQVNFLVQYREAGTADPWVNAAWSSTNAPLSSPAGQINTRDNTTENRWYTGRWTTPKRAKWSVRVFRATGDTALDRERSASFWSVLRSIRHEDPIKVPGMFRVTLRLLATAELQGNLPPIWVRTRSYWRVWNSGIGQFEWQISRSPAWAALNVLRGAENPRPEVDDDIDLDAFIEHAAFCDAKFLHADGVMDWKSPGIEAIDTILAAGWGRYVRKGGLHSVVWDRPPQAPVQHFAPHNYMEFSITKAMPKKPHAILAHYINADRGYQRDVLPIALPGYTVVGDGALTEATEFVESQVTMITRQSQLEKHERREIGVGIHRDLTARLRCAAEHLVVEVGDTVSVTRPQYGWGLGSGRINYATTTSARLSDGMPMIAGQTYAFGIRPMDAPNATRQDLAAVAAVSTESLAIDTGNLLPTADTVGLWWFEGDLAATEYDMTPAVTDGYYREILWVTPDGVGGWDFATLAGGEVPEDESLFQFGELGFVARDWVVEAIERDGVLDAVLSLYPEGPEVLAFADGESPPYNSPMSSQRLEVARPPSPIVDAVISDAFVLERLSSGILVPKIVVELRPAPAQVRLGALRARFRRSDGSSWQEAGQWSVDTTTIPIRGVDQGVKYDIELRYVSAMGIAGIPALVSGHEVSGEGSLPPPVDGLVVTGDIVDWQYPTPPQDFRGFILRYHFGDRKTWADARRAHSEPIWPAPPFPRAKIPGGVVTILVRAIDQGGRLSELRHITRTLSALQGRVILGEQDEGASGWTGSVDFGEVSSGAVRAATTTKFFGDTVDAFFSDPSDPFFTGTWGEVVYIVQYTPPAVLPADLLIDAVITGGEQTIQWREILPPQGNIVGEWHFEGNLREGANTPWSPWSGVLELQDTTYEFMVRVSPGETQGVISVLRFLAVADRVEEFLSGVAIDAAGTRLSLGENYRQIQGVELTVVGDSAGNTAVQVDLDAALGPLVKVRDATGTAVAGTVNATVKGY